MANSKEIRKNLREFQQKHSANQVKAEDKFKNAGVDTPDVSSTETASNDSDINILKAQLREAQSELKEKNSIINRYKQEEDSKENVKNSRAMSDIITGYDKDFFEKDYEFPMGDSEPLKFHVKMRASNVYDYARIEQEVINLCDGQLDYNNLGQTAHLIDALATLRIVGEDVPDWLSKGENFNPAILLKVYTDWTEWLATFLEHQK